MKHPIISTLLALVLTALLVGLAYVVWGAEGHAASTGFRGPSTGFRGPSTGFRGPSTGFREPSTGFREPSTGFCEPSTGFRGPLQIESFS